MTRTQERLHAVPSACEVLGIRKSKLYELLKAGELASVRIGRRRLIPDSALDTYIENLKASGAA